MFKLNKTERISIRLNEKENEMIRRKAKEKNMSMSKLMLTSVKNHIMIEMNTSDYRHKVIKVKRIGDNVNRIIKNYHSNRYISNGDIKNLQLYLKSIDEVLKEDSIYITKNNEKGKKITQQQLLDSLRKEGRRIPKYLIYEEISDYIITKLRRIIDLASETELAQGYVPFYERYIQTFHPTFFEYDDLVDFSDKLDEKILEVEKTDIRNVDQLEDKLMEVLEVLNEYRKDSPE
ncbi:plasmid mobilization protein [Senegalia sp. (in: firmicutes)]|uniref:plasmid mobilization protein n=1 Tax=Senegalia sp. (in: firmicutes) TaxID=1924098 RepID=UPI003F9D1190